LTNTEIFRNLWPALKPNIVPGSNVVIVTDPQVDRDIPNCLVEAMWAAAAIPTVIVIPTPRFHDQLSAPVAAAIYEADLLVAATSRPISRTTAVQAARNHGVKYLAMGGVTPETLLTGSILVDYDELYEITEKYAKVIEEGSMVHISTPAGTDLSFSIYGRKSLSLNGRMDDISNSFGIPSGEAATSPVEGTANGIAVIDGGMHEIGLIQTPIVLKIEDGFVVDISGGAEADQLRTLLRDSGDENSYNIGEFAFGTNSASAVAHNIQEFKNKLGTIHLALGNNLNLFGHTRSKTHLDAIMKDPTVTVDGKIVLDKGVPTI